MKRYRVVFIESNIYLKNDNKEFLSTMYPDLRNLINERNNNYPFNSFYIDSIDKNNSIGVNVETELHFFELQSKINRYLIRSCLPKYLLIEEDISLSGTKHYEYFSHTEITFDSNELKRSPISKNDLNKYLNILSEEEKESIKNSFNAFDLGIEGNVGDFTKKVVKIRVKY